MEECLPAVVYEGGEQIIEYCLKKIIIMGLGTCLTLKSLITMPDCYLQAEKTEFVYFTL
jgi:hypothetical protein